VLRKYGLDPDRDLECVERAPGDYQMDLRHLRDGSIDAAYVGSTFSARRGRGRGGLFGAVLGRRPLPDPHGRNRR
jgi:hypothetical protein